MMKLTTAILAAAVLGSLPLASGAAIAGPGPEAAVAASTTHPAWMMSMMQKKMMQKKMMRQKMMRKKMMQRKMMRNRM